ncbi:MAG: hypothetical protein K2X91_02545, partial [Thermoleophilia bacterium]|nr:hypothetical protein [Thermoleophilia bacterium]
MLLASLALHNGDIDPAQLAEVLRVWSADRSRSIGRILLARGLVDTPRLTLLKALVEDHRRRHGDGPAADRLTEPARRILSDLADLEPDPFDGLPDADRTTVRERTRTEAVTDAVPDSGGTADGGGGDQDGYEILVSAGRYRVGPKFNAGGLGTVHHADDRELRRPVVFKRIREDRAFDPSSRQQFILEGLVTGGLEHPGIVPVYGLGRSEDGRLFYAMRLLGGTSLRKEAKRLHSAADEASGRPSDSEAEAEPIGAGPPLPPPTLPRLLRHFASACYAIGYANARGVLNRDIK